MNNTWPVVGCSTHHSMQYGSSRM